MERHGNQTKRGPFLCDISNLPLIMDHFEGISSHRHFFNTIKLDATIREYRHFILYQYDIDMIQRQ